MSAKRYPLLKEKSEDGNPLTQSLKKLCLDSKSNSIQLNDQMDVERQSSPQPCNEERTALTPQTASPETHSMVIEPRKDKILIITDPSHALTKDSPSPVTTMAGSPVSKPQDTIPTEMRQIVLINNENHVVHPTVPVSKDGHLMPPSPAHTPQPAPPTTVTQETDHGVRALVVYNEKGEVQDPIIQYVPNQAREDSGFMKDESYPITCGNSKGDLYWKKFICPGINAKCVKCNGMWLTPKEFVQEAGKSTLKDWKRAIRINGTMLRKMIESREIDYYQHETNCSNQCRSNKGPSLESTASQGSFNHSFEITETPSKEHAMEVSSFERSNSEENPSYLNTKRPPMLTVQKLSQESSKSESTLDSRPLFTVDDTRTSRDPSQFTKTSVMSSFERSSSEDSGLAPSPQLDSVIMRESIATADKIQELQAFWSGIIRSDLLDEVIQEILTQISSIQHRAKTLPVVSPEDSVTLTNLANSLELIPAILQKTATQKLSVERQAEQTNHIIQDLERQLAEQKKYDHDLKRKSQVLESVMKITANEKRKRPKMVRLYRQKAVDRPTSSQQQPGTSGQAVASVAGMSRADMASVMSGNPLMRYPGQDLWGGQSGSVAHVLQAASNQMNISGHNMLLPLPHLLPRDPTQFQVHQDSPKK